VQRKQGTALES